MKQFSLEEYIKNPNRRIITKDGRNVRIICTNKNGGDSPILALCTMENGYESCFSYLSNGRRYDHTDSCLDLFFVPEKHEGWINLVRNSNGDIFVETYFPYKDEETAKSVVSTKKLNIVATCKIEWEE